MEILLGLLLFVVAPVALVCWRDIWRRWITFLEYRDALKAMKRWKEHRDWHLLG